MYNVVVLYYFLGEEQLVNTEIWKSINNKIDYKNIWNLKSFNIFGLVDDSIVTYSRFAIDIFYRLISCSFIGINNSLYDPVYRLCFTWWYRQTTILTHILPSGQFICAHSVSISHCTAPTKPNQKNAIVKNIHTFHFFLFL